MGILNRNAVIILASGLGKRFKSKIPNQYFKLNDVRISIDNNICYKLYPGNAFKRDESTIVEIKTSIKKNLDKLIEDFPFQKNRFSKYCNAVDQIVFR